jgi:hypothetical protein
MRVTRRKVPGEERWIVKLDGTAVGEVRVQNTAGGTFMPYRPYRYTDKVADDGDSVLRALTAQSTLDGAVEALAIAGRKPASAAVSDRVTFVGVGMGQKKTDEYAAGIRRRMLDDQNGGDR